MPRDSQSSEVIIPRDVENWATNNLEEIRSLKEWKQFATSSHDILVKACSSSLPFDPRFNAVHWAFDVDRLCRQIGYSLCLLKAYADDYKSRTTRGSAPSYSNFHVTYYIDIACTLIDSCRDKIALMVWAYYYPFNPEKKKEVLSYDAILKRLKNPKKFGISLKVPTPFTSHLDLLINSDFELVESYRHLKIHRQEPRVEIYGVATHHGWPYMIPLTDKDEIKARLEELYDDPSVRKTKEAKATVNGVFYDWRKLKLRVWDYEELRSSIDGCLLKLLRAADGCFRTLLDLEPLRSR